MSQSGLTICFSGMVAADPNQGGAIWAVLQYVLGLKRLGHRVILIEPIPAAKISPKDALIEQSINAACFRRVMSAFGLEDCACLLVDGTRQTVGLEYEEVRRVAREADLLINISGMLADAELIRGIPCRVFLDLDPAFVQLWHATQQIDMRLDNHTHFVTVGQSIGTSRCAVPTCGKEWITTLPPVVLEHWPVGETIEHDGLTTIGNWRGYGSIHHDGVHYGQKAHSFRRFYSAPQQTRERFMPALAIHPAETADLAALSKNGWQLLDPADVAGSPDRNRRFVRGSKAELGIAKSGYVESRCGWFSDRSACYLACGRPVLAQETGFSNHLPTGEGLLSFNSLEALLDAIQELNRDYCDHAMAARRIAETYFDSDVVLNRLLTGIGF